MLLALHGNYDRPEWQCATWRTIVGDRGFVLCPRGVARKDSPSPSDVRFTYDAHFTPELEASIAALKSRYGDYVDAGPIVYTGFSLGAILGARVVQRDPARFPRAVLIEGGQSGWNAKGYAAKGGARVLFACGQGGCVTESKQAASMLERARVASRVVYGEKEGHSYTGLVADRVREQFDWLVDGDARWAR